jgi:hypothetical protein
LNILLAFRNAVVVVADTDNLRYTAKESRKGLDHRGRKLHGPLFARNVGCIWVAREPSGVRVCPHIETMAIDRLELTAFPAPAFQLASRAPTNPRYS